LDITDSLKNQGDIFLEEGTGSRDWPELFC